MARREPLIWLAVLTAALLSLAVAAEVALHAIDMNAIKARLIAEAQHRTGRALALDNLQLHFFPDLRVDADDLALANPAGFSRPAMLTATHLTARVALLPLLRRQVIVTDLTLHGADLTLERPAEGPPNWVFATGRPSASLPHAEPAIALPRMRLDRLTLLGLTLDGTIAWQAPGMATHLPITRLTLREVNDSSTIALDAASTLGGDPVRLTGQFGGQNHLWHPNDASPWPVNLHLTSPDGAIDLVGSLTAPDRLAGYDVTLTADGPDIGKLFAIWPSLPVPRLTDLHLQTRLIDRPDGIDMPHLALTAGSSDLSPLIEGLAIDKLAIAAPNIDGGNGSQRNSVAATGHYAGQALTIEATLGPVGRLFGRGGGGAGSPIALDAALDVAGADLSLHGHVAPAGNWSGTALALAAHIPDLSLLSPLARRTLPQWQGIAVSATAVAHGGQLTLSDAAFTAPVAQFTAQGTAWLGGRPRIAGSLHATTLDLDAIAAAWRTARSPAAPGQHPAASASDNASWIIPDRPLPALVPPGFDADVAVSADRLRLHGIELGNVVADTVISASQLAIDPLAADIGTAHLAGRLAVDATAVPPAYQLRLTASGLDAGTVLALAGLPPVVRGRLDLDADLTAAGTSPHALAATLGGSSGIALTNGAVDTSLLSRVIKQLSPVARFGLNLPGKGLSDIACLATRLDIRQGIAAPSVFLLDSARVRLAAAGAIDLGNERFALRLRPYIVLGGTGLILPSRADGPWNAPRLTLEAAGLPPSAADAALALADTGNCAQALAAARDTSTAEPSQPILPPPAVKPLRRSPLDLLKHLFHFAPTPR